VLAEGYIYHRVAVCELLTGDRGLVFESQTLSKMNWIMKQSPY
jgi:hypothetical protein